MEDTNVGTEPSAAELRFSAALQRCPSEKATRAVLSGASVLLEGVGLGGIVQHGQDLLILSQLRWRLAVHVLHDYHQQDACLHCNRIYFALLVGWSWKGRWGKVPPRINH